MKTVIIGNGILALTTAFRMLEKLAPNDLIVIIGKQERRGSATLVAPAMLNSFAELEPDSLSSEEGRYKFQLSMESTKAWPDFLAKIVKSAGVYAEKLGIQQAGPGEHQWFDTGTYVINNTASDALDDENFDAIVSALQAYNQPFQWIMPADIPNYIPKQQYRAARAIYIDNEGWFNPRILMQMLEHILNQHPQVQLIDCYASKLIQRANEILSVQTDDNEIIAGDKFLLAAGAATTDLVQASELTLAMQRVFYGVGVTLQIDSPSYQHSKCVRTPNRGLACGLYTAPYFHQQSDRQHIAIGASNFISPTPCNYGRLTSVSTLLTSVVDQINTNFYKAELVRVNVGERPLSQDGYPLVGATSIKNLILATGTRREGVHLSPVLSEKLADILMNKKVDKKFSLFQPERALICELSRDDAIKKGVKHSMSAIYQHGFVASDESMIKKLKEKYEDDLQRVHDKAGAIDWGIPVDMIDMYRYGHAVAPAKVETQCAKHKEADEALFAV